MRRGITVAYVGVDGYWKTRTFQTLRSARLFAENLTREQATGCGFVVNQDGTDTIRVHGVTLSELFPGIRRDQDDKSPE